MAKGTIYEHREPTETELAWVTGIWEGEGSWSYKKGRTRTFANGKTYTDGGPVHKAAGQKQIYYINLQGEAAKRWTELMKFYLGNRRREKYEMIMEKLNASYTKIS